MTIVLTLLIMMALVSMVMTMTVLAVHGDGDDPICIFAGAAVLFVLILAVGAAISYGSMETSCRHTPLPVEMDKK